MLNKRESAAPTWDVSLQLGTYLIDEGAKLSDRAVCCVLESCLNVVHTPLLLQRSVGAAADSSCGGCSCLLYWSGSSWSGCGSRLVGSAARLRETQWIIHVHRVHSLGILESKRKIRKFKYGRSQLPVATIWWGLTMARRAVVARSVEKVFIFDGVRFFV